MLHPPPSRTRRRRARPPAPAATLPPRRPLRRAAAALACGRALLLAAPPSAAAQQSWQSWARQDAPADGDPAALAGTDACAGCDDPPGTVCAETTLAEGECLPCATGQTWFPCNLVGECFCRRPTAAPTAGPTTGAPTAAPATEEPTAGAAGGGSPGGGNATAGGATAGPTAVVAVFDDPRCTDERQCWNSFYDQCYHATSDECTGPRKVMYGETDGGGGEEQEKEAVEVVEEAAAAPPPPPVDPAVLEGLYVIDAHMAANKIALARELLAGPGRRDAGFSYAGLRDSLRAMAVHGAANQTFYLGGPAGNGRAHGLVNLVAFLAASAQDSIRRGGCDEVNRDAVGGVLPLSNACGQHGRNYQDPGACPAYACAVDPTLRAAAGAGVPGDWWDGGAGDRAAGAGGVPPPPFACGPRSDYGGTTGHWDYVSGTEVEGLAKNALGKDHVEGCCWWGRGAVQIRGACAYGKLNYHLGKRAHDEGRPALYPDVDFCRDPQAVCSSARYPDLRWTAGLFRWITEVQTYQRDGFDYMRELAAFVDGGMRDWTFAHGVAGIVAQGCHAPPCGEGTEFDGADHMATFRKTLKLFGLLAGDGTDAG